MTDENTSRRMRSRREAISRFLICVLLAECWLYVHMYEDDQIPEGKVMHSSFRHVQSNIFLIKK